jgi:hypothetical protein
MSEIIIDFPSSLKTHLAAWLKDQNPKGHEDVAADLKAFLCEFVDAHTLCRATIERDTRDQLASFKVYFLKDSIEVYDSGVTLHVTGAGWEGSITLSNNNFDNSEDLERLAQYAEELENSVWDDSDVESLVEKWFSLEK